MNLKVSIKKEINKASIITIRRSDGSITWSKLHKGMETHDFAHYAVEKHLGFNHAFFGIINKGYAISDFGLPKLERPDAVKPKNLHPEALITEHLVNLLEVEYRHPSNNDNFIEDLKRILHNANLPLPEKLSTNTLFEIRNTYKNLVNKWKQLSGNGVLQLELSFNK